MKKCLILAVGLVLALGLATAPFVHAQGTTTGNLDGRVIDESGAVLPGTTVSISSPALMMPQLVNVANQEGYYRFPSLPPGRYTVTFEMTGFSRSELLMMSVPDLHPPEALDGARQALEQVQHAERVRFESQMKRFDGTVFDVEISARVVDSENGGELTRTEYEHAAREDLGDWGRRLNGFPRVDIKKDCREVPYDENTARKFYLAMLNLAYISATIEKAMTGEDAPDFKELTRIRL